MVYLMNYFLLIKVDGQPNEPTQILLLINIFFVASVLLIIWSISSQSVIIGQDFLQRFQKAYIKRKLDLTPISIQGKDMQNKDCLENYILFCPHLNELDHNTIKTLWWQPIWEDFIKKLDYEALPIKIKEKILREQKSCCHWLQTQYNDQDDFDILIMNKVPPVLRPNPKKISYTIYERFIENKMILEAIGEIEYNQSLEFYHNHFSFIKQLTFLIGPDAYYDGEFNYCNFFPFPFTLGFIKETKKSIFSKGNEAFYLNRLEDFQNFFYYNTSDPSVNNKKLVRMKLRALEGKLVCWPIVKNFVVTTKDSEGKKGIQSINFNFTNCIFIIKRNISIKSRLPPFNSMNFDLGPGMDIVLDYRDGKGTDKYGNTHRKSIKVPGKEIGACSPWESNSILEAFFQKNHLLVSENLPTINQNINNYRQKMSGIFFETKIFTLQYDFNLRLMRNFDRSNQELQQIFLDELNPTLRNINFEEGDFADLLNLRGKILNDNQFSWWFIFWYDLWKLNDQMKEFERNENFLNPIKKASFAQSIIEKEHLATHLKGMGLMKYFKKFKMLDKIYERLEKIGGKFHCQQNILITLPMTGNNDVIFDNKLLINDGPNINNNTIIDNNPNTDNNPIINDVPQNEENSENIDIEQSDHVIGVDHLNFMG